MNKQQLIDGMKRKNFTLEEQLKMSLMSQEELVEAIEDAAMTVLEEERADEAFWLYDF